MEKIAYECDLLDAMNAALEFRVVQVGYVKYTEEDKDVYDVDIEPVTYDLYRTLSDIPIYVIVDKIDKIKIIGINNTLLPQYTVIT
jgi:hypothetical protein